MRKRMIVGAAVAAFAVGGAALAFGASEQRTPVPLKAGSKPVEKDLAKVKRGLRQAQAARVRCRSIGCVNRSLTKLANDVNALENNVEILRHDAFDCEQLVNITRYGGYLWTPNAGGTVFTTTALDITTPGDPASARAVVYVC